MITNQPQSLTVCAGQSATFTVAVTGTPPLSYQWIHDGVPIPGSSSTNLTLAAAQPANTGGYTVVVANACGSVTNLVATLTVLGATPPTLLCSDTNILCGSPIPTNPPPYIDACCTNVTVTLISTVGTTNGCSQTIIQTWQAVDQCCGTSKLLQPDGDGATVGAEPVVQQPGAGVRGPQLHEPASVG